MVEVLVAVLVLALGVIGAAGMQVTALRTAQQSGLHGTALHLAVELADRMRANDAQMRLDDAENPYLGIDISGADEPPPEPDVDCFSVDCNGAQLARFELHDWARRLGAALPGARAVVCRDSAPWDGGKRRLAWDCATDHAASIVIKIGWAAKDPGGRLDSDIEDGSYPEIALLVAPYAP